MTEIKGGGVEAVLRGVYKEGSNYFYDPKVVVPESTKRGIKIVCETAQHRNRRINEGILKNLHEEVLYYMPGVKGKYRECESAVINSSKKVDGVMVPVTHTLTSGKELGWRMYMFGQWLEEKTELVKDKPNDLVLALETACEASYGLVSPELHPFYDGNGRVSRLLCNLILMLNTHELIYYGKDILPVPEMRKRPSGIVGGNKEIDPYIKVLSAVGETKDLNPYIRYVGLLWMQNLNTLLINFDNFVKAKKQEKFYEGDSGLIGKFKDRISVLQKVVNDLNPTNNPNPHLMPNYCRGRHL